MKTNTDEGLKKCKRCNGNGYVFQEPHTIYRCKSCAGVGEMDWVKNITRSFHPGEIPFIITLVKRWEADTGIEFFIVKTGDNWAFGEPIYKEILL
jgi:hypothetical protein